MDITPRVRRKHLGIKQEQSEFSHDLCLYKTPPQEQLLALSEFETLATERLQALRILEQATIRGLKKFSEEWRSRVKTEWKKENLHTYLRLIKHSSNIDPKAIIQARKNDQLSHFILILAYCRTENNRQWLIQRELELFKFRFLELRSDAVRSFLELNKLNYQPIDEVEKNEVRSCLRDSTAGLYSDEAVMAADFYKVTCWDVVDLIRGRRVFLQKGFAFVPSSEFVSILLSLFRMNLSKSLSIANFTVPQINDTRIKPLLENLHGAYLGKDYANVTNANTISIDSLDSLSRTSYPICMRHLHESLQRDHHLKHWGRQQYGLFIKGIGVSLEAALEFWKTAFCHKMDGGQFEKQYSYSIRHNYGKEGSKINYTPYSCMKIIMSNVGPGDCHGCPFKHFDQQILKTTLQSYGVSTQGSLEILDYVKNGHFQIACSKYFELTHKTTQPVSINHPNQYFEESRKVVGAKVGVSYRDVYKTGPRPVNANNPNEQSKPTSSKSNNQTLEDWDESLNLCDLPDE